MSHGLEQFADGSTAYAGVGPAWHRLGANVSEAMTATEVLQRAQLAGWNVRKSPSYILVPGPDGTEVPQAVPNRFHVVRTNPVDGGTDPLGEVSDRYQLFQNEELASVIDTVADVSGAHFDTAGSLQDGRKVFVNMKLPNGFTVAGKDTEEHDVYLLGIATHDGKAQTQFITTPVRVVCQNTLSAGLNSLITRFGVSHRGDMDVKVQEVRDALEVQHKALDDFQAEAERMLDAAMSREAFASTVTQLFGKSESPAAERRNAKMAWLWDEAPTLEGIRGTRWAAWQAITEYVDHYDSPTGSAENRAVRAVDGTGLKRKEAAYKLLAV